MPRVMDDEYVAGTGSGESDAEEMLSDDADDYRPSASRKRAAGAAGRGGTRGGGSGAGAAGAKRGAGSQRGKQKASLSKDKGYAWEATYKRSWDAVREDEGGSLAGAVRGLLEASKRRRLVGAAKKG